MTNNPAVAATMVSGQQSFCKGQPRAMTNCPSPAMALTLNEECNLMPVNTWRTSADTGWTRIASVVGSGCVEHVGPPEMAPDIAIAPSVGASRGQTYSVANGEDLDNLGQKTLAAHTAEGQSGPVTFQMANVTRPLFSVGQACDDGNLVIFGSMGGMILNVNTHQVSSFKRVNRNYELDFGIPNSSQGFTRQGNM